MFKILNKDKNNNNYFNAIILQLLFLHKKKLLFNFGYSGLFLF